jgi:hypothetical protein
MLSSAKSIEVIPQPPPMIRQKIEIKPEGMTMS